MGINVLEDPAVREGITIFNRQPFRNSTLNEFVGAISSARWNMLFLEMFNIKGINVQIKGRISCPIQPGQSGTFGRTKTQM